MTPSGPGRVLLVEDEMLVSMLIEDMLTSLGYEVLAVGGNRRKAMMVIETQQIDVAILDINLSGTLSYPIADALAARGIPFVFVTGYGETTIAPPFSDRLVVRKPIRADDLERAMSRIVGRAAT